MSFVQAPRGLMAGRRRPLRLGNVEVTLEDLLMLVWRVPPDPLSRLLPAGLEPLVHEGNGLLAALVFRNRALRPARLGLPRLSCLQMNLRSHILDPRTGLPGSVFFHCFRLQRPWLAWLAARAFRIPCEVSPLRIRTLRADAPAGGQGDAGSAGPAALEAYQVASDDGSVSISARARPSPPTADDRLVDLLTNVHTGYIRASRPGALLRWSIWHPAKRLQALEVDRAELAPVGVLGLQLPPVSHAFYVASIDYEVYLPPLRIPLGGPAEP